MSAFAAKAAVAAAQQSSDAKNAKNIFLQNLIKFPPSKT
jgi:hypothetical protein